MIEVIIFMKPSDGTDKLCDWSCQACVHDSCNVTQSLKRKNLRSTANVPTTLWHKLTSSKYRNKVILTLLVGGGNKQGGCAS